MRVESTVDSCLIHCHLCFLVCIELLSTNHIFCNVHSVVLGERIMIKSFSTIIFTVLLANALLFALNAKPANAYGTIYIRSDGSIDPPDAPIQRNGDIYTVTGNISSEQEFGIVIEKSSSVFDGAGYTLEGTGSAGIYLNSTSDVTIKNAVVKGFADGIRVIQCMQPTILGNTLIENGNGIFIFSPSGWSNITGNRIEKNNCGVSLLVSEAVVYHNNFIENSQQAATDPYGTHDYWFWNWPIGGNYWSDYNGIDANNDGFGDTRYFISASIYPWYPYWINEDYLPLMKPYAGPHDIGLKVKLQKTVFWQGSNKTATANVIIINYGESSETFNFTYKSDATLHEQTLTLGARESANLFFAWNTTSLPKGTNNTIVASLKAVEGERDLGDNNFTITLRITQLGDVKLDYKVNVLDLIWLSKHLGHANGDGHVPGTNDWWDCMNCDVREDEWINVLDLILTAKQLGS